MADNKDIMDEDYLDSLLNAVSTDEDVDLDSLNLDEMLTEDFDNLNLDESVLEDFDNLNLDEQVAEDLSEESFENDMTFETDVTSETDVTMENEVPDEAVPIGDTDELINTEDLFDTDDIPNIDDSFDTDEDFNQLLKELELSEDDNSDIENIAGGADEVQGVSEEIQNEDDNSIPDAIDDIDNIDNIDDILSSDFGLEDLGDIDSLDDIEDKGSTKKDKKEKKGFFSKIFGKKDKDSKTKPVTESDVEMSSDDNVSISDTPEQENLGETFDLSEFDEFDSLDDLEDRSSGDDEKSEAERKAEKEQKKKEKKKEKAEKKKAKKEKAEQKKREKAEKKRLKAEKPKPPAEKIKISPKGVILSLSVIVIVIIGLVFGGKTFWYSKHINDASDLLLEKKYVDAYDVLTGITPKEDDKGLYNQLRTLMLIQREYDSYEASITMKRPVEGLSSLIKGVKRYNENKDKAEVYGVEKDANTIYTQICKSLNDVYGLSPEDATKLNNMKDNKEYTKKLTDIVNKNDSNIQKEYEKYTIN